MSINESRRFKEGSIVYLNTTGIKNLLRDGKESESMGLIDVALYAANNGSFLLKEFDDSNGDHTHHIVSTSNEELNVWVHEDEIYDSLKEANAEDVYTKKGKEIGELVANKQKAYGNAVERSHEVIKALIEPYHNKDDKTYTIPESLLPHLLLMVRMIDKLNRIVNNPDQDLMEENTYDDITGYSLIGSVSSRR